VKSTGTAVASISFAALLAFFVYQTWFNPTRAVQRRLSEIAAALSMPDHEPPVNRIGRVAQLRKFLSPDIRIHAGTADITSRDQVVGIVSAIAAPPGGLNVQFVDVQVRVNHDTGVDADAYMTVELNGKDSETGQPTAETHEASVTLKKIDGEWVVATAEAKESLHR
jgi:hypothetical protein